MNFTKNGLFPSPLRVNNKNSLKGPSPPICYRSAQYGSSSLFRRGSLPSVLLQTRNKPLSRNWNGWVRTGSRVSTEITTTSHRKPESPSSRRLTGISHWSVHSSQGLSVKNPMGPKRLYSESTVLFRHTSHRTTGRVEYGKRGSLVTSQT